MRKSSFIDEYVDEAILSSCQTGICRILQNRFGNAVTSDLLSKIRKQANEAILSKWFDVACTVESLGEFETD